MKRLAFLFAVAFLLGSVVLSPAQEVRRRGLAAASGVAVTDDFNRANANPIGGNWSAVSGWTGAQIVSNAVSSTAPAAIYWNAATFANNQYSQVKLAGAYSVSAAVRCNGTACYIWFVANATTMRYYRATSSGSYTQIGGDITGVILTTSTLRLEVSGTTLTGYIDGVAQTTQTDATYASGSPGLHWGSGTASMDDWAGGDL